MDIGRHGISFGDTDCISGLRSIVIACLAVKIFTIVFCKITQI